MVDVGVIVALSSAAAIVLWNEEEGEKNKNEMRESEGREKFIKKNIFLLHAIVANAKNRYRIQILSI